MLFVQFWINSTRDVWTFCQIRLAPTAPILAKFPNITRTVNSKLYSQSHDYLYKYEFLRTELTKECIYSSRTGFELASSGFWTAALPFELSSQLGLVASLIQFKCTKYFRDDLTLVFEDAQCFNSISGPSSEI